MAFASFATEVIVPIQQGVGVARSAVGERNYQSARSAGITGYGLVNALMPVPPMIGLMPLKVGVFIVTLLIFIFVFDMGWKSLVAAYFMQAVAVLYVANWMNDRILSWGVGV